MDDTISWVRLLPGLLAAAVGLGTSAGWRRYSLVRFSIQAAGAAVWAGSVALKFTWALPMNSVIHAALPKVVGEHLAEPLFWLYVGLLTGIFEVGGTMAVVRLTRLRYANHSEALAFGVGFGAAEAVAVALVTAVPVALMLFAPGGLPLATKEALVRVLGGPVGIAAVVFPPLERASALVCHVVTCALVIHGFRVGRAGAWGGVAFAYKSVIDAAATWAVMSFGVKSSDVKLVVFEIGLGAFAIASVWALKYVLSTHGTPLVRASQAT